ncbi:MAG: flagellar basal body L-ring protein FlgH [Acidobacteria bacterium]|nr:flagellar basal body L-ring protein FlgH [Acidobacteriota bacterium]
MKKILILGIVLILPVCGAKKKKAPPEPSALDRYIQEARATAGPASEEATTPGSLWSSSARYFDLASDLRASRVNDIITIVVDERASAIATGATKTGRKSTATASVTAAGGLTRAVGPWANLAGANSDVQLDDSGTTSRQTTLSTVLSARVIGVMSNGNLIVEGTKSVTVNSENQMVIVRGVIRPVDLATGNTVSSDRLAELEIKVNGKGVVGDAIRRPFILYRILLGLLPF